jgi:DNA-binding MarR family transcriptional regulator
VAQNRVSGDGGRSNWTFLSNHGHVLLCIASDPEIRMRDLADLVGITERAAQWIISDLEAAGYLKRDRVGRRNRYTLRLSRPLRHPLERGHKIRELVELLKPDLSGGG